MRAVPAAFERQLCPRSLEWLLTFRTIHALPVEGNLASRPARPRLIRQELCDVLLCWGVDEGRKGCGRLEPELC